MRFIKGAVKIAKGLYYKSIGEAHTDGAPIYCNKCKCFHQGICPEYRKEGDVLIKEGIEEVKNNY